MAGYDTLGAGDEGALEAFLGEHAHSSMFLRSNLAAGGIVDRGRPHQSTYVASRDAGGIRGVVGHSWHGILQVQAPVDVVGDLARAAAERSGRAVAGLVGPWAQVVAARAALGGAAARARLSSHEDLFALDLADMVVPAPLAEGRLRCRRPESHELPLLVDWRVAYDVEISNAADSAALRQATLADIARLHARGATWVVTAAGEPVAYSGFNAQLPDIVQVGGVYTPPAHRGRGFARAVVAGSLLDARAAGARQAVLFTGKDNEHAQRAYRALGFRVVGDYGVVLFSDP
jgi:ribosomal protein S18 acetylase RimI-like enzyme